MKNVMKSLFEHAMIAVMALTCGFALCGCSDDNDDEDAVAESNLPPVVTEEEHVCAAPDFLREGDKIAIVSPSYVTDDETIQQGMEAIRSWGFEPVLAPNANRLYLVKYAGTPEERAADLEWAYTNTDIKAIMTTRGGYGAVQLLPLLGQNMVTDHPKWLIGYSDITTLLSFSVSSKVMAIHGTMLSSLKTTGGSSDDDLLLKSLLLGELPHYEWQSSVHANRPGTATGMLVGGNMSTFTPLIGSDYDFTSRGDIILFVEEIGENARNIDRMMYSLRIHGVLSRVKGILVGDFASCGDDFSIGSIEEMLDKYTLSDLNIPIAYGFRAGHAGVNMPLVMGAQATMDVTAGAATLSFDIP
ncbi:MAG: LD-carboxypeptidase [Prevotella sp.]